MYKAEQQVQKTTLCLSLYFFVLILNPLNDAFKTIPFYIIFKADILVMAYYPLFLLVPFFLFTL